VVEQGLHCWKIAKEKILQEITLKKIPRILLITVVFCTLVAIFLTSVKFGDKSFLTNFIFSQCIGISSFLCIFTVRLVFKPVAPLMKVAAIVIPMVVGSLAGTILGSFVAGINLSLFLQRYGFFIQVVLLGILFGSIISYFFISRERIATTEELVQEEKIKRLTSEKRGIEANLRLLQAQIEPHFLFNTLSNILSLLDTDLKKGQSMLMDLTHYLRTSLSKTREGITTLGQELEMIKAYLNIFKVRMEDRLHYKLDVPQSIKDRPFPPMLIQPLVENAIRHGIEPNVEGGTITIRARKNGDVLRVEIADTGTGLHEDGTPGLGLSNVRERLKSLYGDSGRLILEENRPSGLKAIIEVPYVPD
jgi:sensor histidine kinase YesM